MCIVIDLDVVCLICLQHDNQMHCIFSPDAENPNDGQIAHKITTLSELKLDKNNEAMPEKICGNCLNDLRAAWRFRKNCQAAKTIFQTIFKGSSSSKTPLPTQLEECDDAATKQLSEQKIKVPQGLQIKRVQSEDMDEVASVSKSISNCKPGESLLNTTQAKLELEKTNDEDISTIYDELASSEYDKGYEVNEVDEEEFNNLDEAREDGVENEDDDDEETALIEYYIADEGGQEVLVHNIESITTALAEKLQKSRETPKNHPTQHNNDKEMDLTIASVIPAVEFKQPIDTVHNRRGRPRQIEQELPTSSKQELKPAKHINTRSNPNNFKPYQRVVLTNSALQSRHNDEASPSDVREVRTRKRKALSPDTKTPKICEICGNSYRFQHALNAHMRRHYNDKPFPCEFCDKAFVSNVELRRHMRVHTGVKPYACQYCDRRFSDFGSRIKHERTHTGERPYVCSTCNKSFAYPHVLSVHLRTHTGEKRFRCEHCSKGFTKKAYLLTHIEQHHNLSNFQVVIDDPTENSQLVPMKSVAFEECIFTTELINEATGDIPDEDEEDYEDHKIIIQEAFLDPKDEIEDEEDMHEVVEIQPDEYTIRVR